MTIEMDKELGNSAGLNAAIRSAKRAARPGKIGVALSKGPTRLKHDPKRKAKSHKSSVFEQDLSARRAHSEGARAKKGDAIGGTGKRKDRQR